MKKVLCVLAAIAMIAAVSTSCKKQCTCQPYIGGQPGPKMTVKISDVNPNAKTCKDLNEGDKEDGVICK